MTPPELNYDIYDKELLAIVIALREWRAFLQGIAEPFVIKTDHKNLTGFLTTKELNQRQVRWAEMLSSNVIGLVGAESDLPNQPVTN